MGNHAVSGKDATGPKSLCLPAVRAVAASGVLAMAVWAVNPSGSAPEAGTLTASVIRPGAGMGAVGIPAGSSTGTSSDRHGSRESGAPTLDGLVAGPLTAAILSDPQVEIAFPRPLVSGHGEETPSALAVELTAVGRPPAGYLMAPLKQLAPSSPFGFRVSPLSGAAGDFHLGQDYAAPCGTQVHAADAGEVRAAGWHPWGGGNRVEIDHGNGLITTYNHLESIAVRSGDSVSAGQAIARVGSTGWSTGCHLHFETILDGHHVSPQKWRLIALRPFGGGPADLRSYLPGTDAPSTGPIRWTIPVGQGSEPPPAPRWVKATTTTAGSPSSPASWLSTLRPADSGTPSPTAWAGYGTPTPSATETGTGTPTPSATETGTGTPSPSPTETGTGTPSPSPTESETGTPSPSPTETGTPTPTPTETGTPTPTPTETGTPTPTDPGTGTPTPVEPAPAPVEPAPVEPVPVPVEPVPVEPAPTPVEPVPVEPAPTPVEPVPVEPAPTPVEPVPVEPAPTPVEPVPVEPAPAPTATFSVEPVPAPSETTEPVPLPTGTTATQEP
ncbi:peptidoglycan DD-metalloendopeptidase family protein [Pseudarthrobacter oxydans]|uniref:M23 family metallopeptidase n=1 Tax=Pseudarthrobacter oxydans TaxID=1671 RepID=UPI003825A2D5